MAPMDEVIVNEDELILLAKLINAEVGDSSEECMYACGSVVLNRVHNDRYPDTIKEVIYQRGQYSVARSGRINREPNDMSLKVAEDLLRNGSTIPENVIYQAMFKQGKGVWKKIDKEYFCYE